MRIVKVTKEAVEAAQLELDALQSAGLRPETMLRKLAQAEPLRAAELSPEKLPDILDMLKAADHYRAETELPRDPKFTEFLNAITQRVRDDVARANDEQGVKGRRGRR